MWQSLRESRRRLLLWSIIGSLDITDIPSRALSSAYSSAHGEHAHMPLIKSGKFIAASVQRKVVNIE